MQDLLSSKFPSKNRDEDLEKNKLCLVMSGCENSSLTLREESRLCVFENRLLSKILGSKS